jgi:hypothetical protein
MMVFERCKDFSETASTARMEGRAERRRSPVEEHPNEPRKSPVEEPGEDAPQPPPANPPPVKEPPNEPDKPPLQAVDVPQAAARSRGEPGAAADGLLPDADFHCPGRSARSFAAGDPGV